MGNIPKNVSFSKRAEKKLLLNGQQNSISVIWVTKSAFDMLIRGEIHSTRHFEYLWFFSNSFDLKQRSVHFIFSVFIRSFHLWNDVMWTVWATPHMSDEVQFGNLFKLRHRSSSNGFLWAFFWPSYVCSMNIDRWFFRKKSFSFEFPKKPTSNI